MKTIEILEVINQKFGSGIPNGFLLGWDADRFLIDFKSIIGNDFKLINQTDFSYSYCNSYDILIDRTLVLTIQISFIVDLYSIHLTKYSTDRKQGKVIPLSPSITNNQRIKKLIKFLENNKFEEISDIQYSFEVEDLSLELADKPIIANFIFEDYE